MKNKMIYFFILICSHCCGQNRNVNWVFGDSAGINFNNINMPLPFSSSMVGRGSCVSFSDTLGNLICYSNTVANTNGYSTQLWNKNNSIMQNGDSIIGEAWYAELTFVPMPLHDDTIFLISHSCINPNGLFYSKVDLNSNGNLGNVIKKNETISLIKMGDCLQAIKHGNGRDWWIITKPSINSGSKLNRFYVFKLDNNGVSTYTTTDFNNATDATFQKIIFNNQGNKLIVINFGGFMAEYNFDRCAGLLSNEKIIFPEQTSNFNRYFWEGAYSPNDSLFYCTSQWSSIQNDTSRVLQFNLFSPNIPASCDTLFEIKYPKIIGAIRLAPDNKIYFTTLYQFGFPSFPFPDSVRNIYNENLSVINYPDNIGNACNLQPFSFYLGGKRTYGGLPNNPNYSLGRLLGSPCDTLQWTNLTPNPSPLGEGKLYATYVAAWEKLFVNASGLKGKSVTVSIYDGRGSLKFEVRGLKSNAGYFTIDVNCAGGLASGERGARWANGLYVVHLSTEKERLSKKFIKE